MNPAALADTITGLGPGPGAALTVRELVERWHDLFLLAGTAAVTLAGLLFIALSLHMELLVQDRHKGALVVARTALTSFLYVMILSILMLSPFFSRRFLAIEIIAFTLVFGIRMGFEMRGAMQHDHVEFSRRTIRRRIGLSIVGLAFVASAGWGLLVGDGGLFYQVMSGTIMLLMNAAYSSWDLLVRVSRIKARTATNI